MEKTASAATARRASPPAIRGELGDRGAAVRSMVSACASTASPWRSWPAMSSVGYEYTTKLPDRWTAGPSLLDVHSASLVDWHEHGNHQENVTRRSSSFPQEWQQLRPCAQAHRRHDVRNVKQ